MKRDEWKLVTSESELAPGMCVELRPCMWCKRLERQILLARYGRMPTIGPRGPIENDSVAFFAAGLCRRPGYISSDWAGYSSAIRERRLYRLIDDDAAETSETTVKRKKGVR